MNIIVAILFDNYEEHDTGESNQELQELDEKAESLGIPESIRDIIIHKDLLLNSKSKTPFMKSMRRYCSTLFSRDKKLKFPETKYFENSFVKFVFEVVNHPAFTLFIFIVIGLNTITLCLDFYRLEGISTMQFDGLRYFNYVFFSIFTLELILKLIGFGCKEFVKDRFNIFDAFVVLISFIEIILESGSGRFTSLRAFRMFRIFKIFRVGELRVLVDCLSKTVRAITPFLICLVLFMYIFTLVGMQFFAGNIKFNEFDVFDKENGESPRHNFDTFGHAFLSVFIILTGENWNSMMYDAMRATSELAAVYFVLVMIMGNIIMLQLLVAIVLSNFDESRKVSAKRSIIDNIENFLNDGMSIKVAVQKVMGDKFIIEEDDDENDGEESPNRIKVIVLKSLKKPISNLNAGRRSSVDLKLASRIKQYLHKSMSYEDPDVKCSEKEESLVCNIPKVMGENKSKLAEDEVEIVSVHLDPDLIQGKLEGVNTDSQNIKKQVTKATYMTNPQVNNIYNNINDEDRKDDANNFDQSEIEEFKSSISERGDSVESGMVVPSDYNRNMQDSAGLKEIASVGAQRQVSWTWNIFSYMSESSLGIFHKDWKFRLFLLAICYPQDDVVRLERVMEVPEKFGITDIGASQKFSILQINAGKIIVKTSTKLKKMSQIFEFFIVVVIFMSCVVLCINTPLENPDTSFSQTLLIFDIIFTIIFTIEAALKIIAFGFF